MSQPDSNATPQLLPCPRCGSAAEVVHASHIRCINTYNCDCETRLGPEAWNRRTLSETSFASQLAASQEEPGEDLRRAASEALKRELSPVSAEALKSPTDDEIRQAIFAYEGALSEDDNEDDKDTARDALLDVMKRCRDAQPSAPSSAPVAVNNDLTRRIDAMHDAILDTEASGRPVAHLFNTWWDLKGAIEPSAANAGERTSLAEALERLIDDVENKWGDPHTLRHAKEALAQSATGEKS